MQDLAVEGDWLYVLTGTKLFALPLTEDVLQAAGSVDAPGDAPIPRRRLFVGNGIAYATQIRGYATFDLKNAAQPVFIAYLDTTQSDGNRSSSTAPVWGSRPSGRTGLTTDSRCQPLRRQQSEEDEPVPDAVRDAGGCDFGNDL